MSAYHRNNPDSEECQQMTRDNERAVFEAKMNSGSLCLSCGENAPESGFICNECREAELYD